MNLKSIIPVFFVCILLIQCSTKHITKIKTTARRPDTLSSEQLIIVIANGWNNVEGTLYAYSKTNGKWIQQFNNPIVIGEKGLGAAASMVPFSLGNAPVKHEGDGKSPAGVFPIGTAFGYADYSAASWIRTNYVKCTDTLICVDDLHSVNYNKIVQKDTATKDYNSHEEMLLQKIYYKWGLVVEYNYNPTIEGNGSCIFIHIWGGEHSGTAGCTAMQEDNMLRLLHFIDKGQHPLLVQFTKENYLELTKQYDLPSIE